MNLIEQLKDPKQAQPFGIYEKYFPEKAEAIKTAYPQGCRFFNDPPKDWEDVVGGRLAFSANTYILKPDYQPEPEYVDLEIVRDGCYLGVKITDAALPILPFSFTHLHCLPSLPGFDHFVRDTGQILLSEHVANAIYSNGKVYAKFRKGAQ